jgi:hypothetical protein
MRGNQTSNIPRRLFGTCLGGAPCQLLNGSVEAKSALESSVHRSGRTLVPRASVWQGFFCIEIGQKRFVVLEGHFGAEDG